MSILLLAVVLSGCRPVGYLLPFGYGRIDYSGSGYDTTGGCITGDCATAGDCATGDCASQPKSKPALEPEDCEPKYSFEVPRGDYEGQECIRRLCHGQQDKCMEKLRIQKESCEHYNAMARIEFSRCLSSGATNCFKNTHTCKTPYPTQCEEDFRRCYVSCGGEVTNSCDKKNENGNGGTGGTTRLLFPSLSTFSIW